MAACTLDVSHPDFAAPSDPELQEALQEMKKKVGERFTLKGPDTLQYRFTIDDPTAFTRTWTGEIIMSRAPGPLYEYACHETNYSLSDILAGARAEEKHDRLEGSGTRPK